MSLPVVAIVGRPNVGKSTFFNRVIGRTLAVVDDTPGITRDRHYALVEWSGVSFHLVDTGGWVPEGREAMAQRILEQVTRALGECDLVLFLVDAKDGMQPDDAAIARELIRGGHRILLVANKVDTDRREADAAEFASLGLAGMPQTISALQGRGMGDLLDRIIEEIPKRESGPERPAGIRITVLGRPNVGKSSLVNRLIGDDRMIVHDVPGTTRDAIDTPFKYHGRPMILIDTAGIRRKMGGQPDYEFYASLRAIRTLDGADVALLVLDASEPITRQDVNIARLIDDSGRACVWVFNKWDLVQKDDKTSARMLEQARAGIPFQAHAPAEFISALTVQRVSRIPERILEAYEAARRKVGTSELNDCVQRAVAQNPPRTRTGVRPVRIYYATQIRTAPPTFALFVNRPEHFPKDYGRYLGRELRQSFGFAGSPIRLTIRKRT